MSKPSLQNRVERQINSVTRFVETLSDMDYGNDKLINELIDSTTELLTVANEALISELESAYPVAEMEAETPHYLSVEQLDGAFDDDQNT